MRSPPKMSKPTTIPLEKEVQKTILKYLVDRGIFCYRNNSGGMIAEHQGKKRFVQFGWPGMPDIVAVIRGQYVAIEVKRPGGKQSDLQKSFQSRLEKAGGKYILAQSVDDISNLEP